MVGVVIAALMLLVLVYVVRLTSVPGRDDRMMSLMVGGYLIRLVINLFSRDLTLFSHGGGGDYQSYEYWATEITRIWSFSGLEYISTEDLRELGPTTLPANLFAVIIALNGGEPTPLGCTGVVAALACLACLNTYHLGIDVGADPRRCFLLTAAFLFSPAFLLYSSDTYKDGLVIFAAITAIGSGLRLARRFSFKHAIVGALALWALWHIRFYLVFVCTAPLVVGLAGLRSRSAVRPIMAVLLMAAAFAVTIGSTNILDSVGERANATFERGTDRRVKAANADSGSGVTFQDGDSATGALGTKLLYQLFSPFPWSGGSLGSQVGKIDTFLWYYFMYRAYVACRIMWREERTTLLMLLSFIVPMTVLYATSFANVGLSLRQRLIIVLVTGILAMRSWPASSAATAGSTHDKSPPFRQKPTPLIELAARTITPL
jgi:hypothetical protein